MPPINCQMCSIENATDRENAERLIRAGAPWRAIAEAFGIGSEAAVRRHAANHMNLLTRPPRRDYSRKAAELLGQHPEIEADQRGGKQ